MSLKLKALSAAPAAVPLYVEDVFSTYLYTGNGSTQTITNGIDLAGEGGLVWIKSRSAATNNFLFDTVRGTTDELNSNTTDAEASLANSVTAFNADGFDIGSATGIGVNAATYASWTFRKTEKFFDVVTYTGNATPDRAIAHGLGSAPGAIFIKRTDSTRNWAVYHRSTTDYDYSLRLNTTDAAAQDNYFSAAPDASNFYIDKSPGGDLNVNASGGTYVAYLFAHNAGGFGDDGSEDVISCGSYVGNASAAGPEINLGWEPQWVLTKAATRTSDWTIADNMRGVATGGFDARLHPQTNEAEAANANIIDFQAKGFQITNTGTINNGSGETYIYIAIRRGPMRAPESGTEVFEPFTTVNSGTPAVIGTMGPTDFILNKRTDAAATWRSLDRLRNGSMLRPDDPDSETGPGFLQWDTMGGVFVTTTGVPFILNDDQVHYTFRRAPGFFDVVAYTGTGSARTVDHNLGVVPELMIVKNRSDATGRAWAVYANNDNTDYLVLNTTAASVDDNTYWNDTSPTASVFTVGTANSTNESGDTFIAYLFATLPGVSKVGSYTGNGSSQTINCGFTSGARFVLIKRTDSTGDWLVGDTARGIVAGNDPYLELNTTAAEDTNEDWLDADSSGFIVNETSTANANVSSATYIYLAIA